MRKRDKKSSRKGANDVIDPAETGKRVAPGIIAFGPVELPIIPGMTMDVEMNGILRLYMPDAPKPWDRPAGRTSERETIMSAGVDCSYVPGDTLELERDSRDSIGPEVFRFILPART